VATQLAFTTVMVGLPSALLIRTGLPIAVISVMLNPSCFSRLL
jgi:hypothetical protein